MAKDLIEDEDDDDSGSESDHAMPVDAAVKVNGIVHAAQ